jgi:hypothetical protein
VRDAPARAAALVKDIPALTAEVESAGCGAEHTCRAPDCRRGADPATEDVEALQASKALVGMRAARCGGQAVSLASRPVFRTHSALAEACPETQRGALLARA